MSNNFETSADVLSYSLGYLVYCKMSENFNENHQLNEDAFNKAVANAARAAEELASMGQFVVINSSFWSVSNATYFFSPLESFQEHQEMCDEVYALVTEFSSHIEDDADDEDNDPVFEFTAEKEYLLACLELDSTTAVNN